MADIGGSVSAHTFGAYFGLGLSKILGKPKDTSLEGPSYQTDLFSIIGKYFTILFYLLSKSIFKYKYIFLLSLTWMSC